MKAESTKSLFFFLFKLMRLNYFPYLSFKLIICAFPKARIKNQQSNKHKPLAPFAHHFLSPFPEFKCRKREKLLGYLAELFD